MMWALLLSTALGFDAERELGGHTFGLPVAVEPVFVDSYISFRQGLGVLTLRDVSYPGIPVPLELELIGITETLRGQVRLGQGVAVYALASGAILAGANGDSALFLGATGGYDLRLGGTGTLLRTERSQLSVRAGGRRTVGLTVTPANLAVDLLDDTQRALQRLARGKWTESILSSQRAWQGFAGVSAATAISPTFGLLASVSGRVGRIDVLTREGEEGGLGLQLGAGAAVDMHPPQSQFGAQVGLQDRVDRLPGLVDTLPERHRTGVVLQGYVELGQVELGLVPSLATTFGSGIRETEWGLEGRAVAFF